MDDMGLLGARRDFRIIDKAADAVIADPWHNAGASAVFEGAARALVLAMAEAMKAGADAAAVVDVIRTSLDLAFVVGVEVGEQEVTIKKCRCTRDASH